MTADQFGEIGAGLFLFRVDDGYANVELDDVVEFCEDDFDGLLLESKKLPPLGGAPVASWILARLKTLSSGTLGLVDEEIEVCDDGVFVVDFVVSKEGVAVAKVQLQAGMIGAGLLGMIHTGLPHSELVDALLTVLIEDPTDLTTCEVRVHDPVWNENPDRFKPTPEPGASNRFGWDGVQFFGADNIQPVD